MNWFKSKPPVNPRSALSDEQLMEAAQREGDMECVGELFKRHTTLVMGVCMKYLKDEEAARDALMQVFENILHKTPEAQILNVRSWLFTVAKNHCLMQLRHEQSEARVRDQKLQELRAELMESEQGMHLYEEEEEVDIRDKIMSAVMKLSYEQRRCVQLFFLEEKSYREISDLTGYDFKQVKTYIQNGKRNLKNMIDHGNPQGS
jgi:RNA polymerase sigma-70 factor (ECF subfamily)